MTASRCCDVFTNALNHKRSALGLRFSRKLEYSKGVRLFFSQFILNIRVVIAYLRVKSITRLMPQNIMKNTNKRLKLII